MSSYTALEQIIGILLTPVPLLPQASLFKRKPPRPGDTAALREKRRLRNMGAASLKQLYHDTVTLQGKLERGQNSQFSVLGHDLRLESTSWVFGELRPGCSVSVQAFPDGGVLRVRKIVRLP